LNAEQAPGSSLRDVRICIDRDAPISFQINVRKTSA
jgi:hypothetical protein